MTQCNLSTHFGHCEQSALFDVDSDAASVRSPRLLAPPAHEPGVLPRWLHEQGADVIITGGMGARAQSLFAQNNITVVLGAPAETRRKSSDHTWTEPSGLGRISATTQHPEMPTYPYQCPACGEFEYEQSITDPPLERCPQCGNAVGRLIGAGTGFIMKGRGVPESRCERDTPCCGVETRCDQPPCGSQRS